MHGRHGKRDGSGGAIRKGKGRLLDAEASQAGCAESRSGGKEASLLAPEGAARPAVEVVQLRRGAQPVGLALDEDDLVAFLPAVAV